MPKNVQLPDGRVVEFPDNMSDEQISAAIDVDQRSPVRRFVENAEDSILGTHTNEGVIKGFTEGIPQMLRHPINSAGLLGEAALKSHTDAADIALRQMHEPGVLPKAIGGVRYLVSGIPIIGPALVQAGEQMRNGDIAGGLGTTAGVGSMLLAPKAGEAAAKLTPVVGEKLKARAEVPYNKALQLKGREDAYSTPARGLAREGVVAAGRPALLDKTEKLIPMRSAQADEVLRLPQHRAIKVNLEQPVSEPFESAISSGTGDLGTASDATLNRLEQTRNELTQRRERVPGGGFRFVGPKLLDAMSPEDATSIKRNIYERTNYRSPEYDESVNNTLRKAGHNAKLAINEAVPEVAPFNERVSDLIGARNALQKRLLSRQVSPTSSGFNDIAPAVIGTAGGGPVAGAAAMVGKRALTSTLARTARGALMYKLGNFLSPEAELSVPRARQPMPTPVRGLLRAAPTQLSSSMEPIDASTSLLPPIDWTTRAVRTGRLLPERTSINLGSQKEPIEDVGPMSQHAASEEQINAGGPGPYRRTMFTTSPKSPRPIRLPESLYGFGPDDEESDIERARRR